MQKHSKQPINVATPLYSHVSPHTGFLRDASFEQKTRTQGVLQPHSGKQFAQRCLEREQRFHFKVSNALFLVQVRLFIGNHRRNTSHRWISKYWRRRLLPEMDVTYLARSHPSHVAACDQILDAWGARLRLSIILVQYSSALLRLTGRDK